MKWVWKRSAVAKKSLPFTRYTFVPSERVKGLYVDGVDKDTLAIPLDGVTRECADMWRKLQDLVKPETLLESAASSALKNLHHPTAAAVLGALGRSMTTSNPGGEPQNLEAKRQILFFANSLFNTTMVKPPPVSRMKSWSCFTPHFSEDVTYSMAQLKGNTGDNVNLQNLLVSLFPDEWDNFCERIGVLTMVAELPKSGQKALQRWASDRAQVLSRTVRGMMRYGDGLRVLACALATLFVGVQLDLEIEDRRATRAAREAALKVAGRDALGMESGSSKRG